MRTLKRKPSFAFLLCLLVFVVLFTIEGTCFLLFKMGIRPRNLELWNVDDFPLSATEVKSVISRKPLYEPTFPKLEIVVDDNLDDALSFDNKLFRLKKNYSIHVQRFTDDRRMVQEYRLKSDGAGRRFTTGLKRDKHVLIMGCSYTFGDGLDDADTLPEILQSQSRELRAYNLGFTADTIDHIYVRAREQNLFDQIPQTEGLAIYLAMTDHVFRSAGAMKKDWRLWTPKLVPQGEFDFKFDGLHWDHVKGWRLVLYFLANSYFAHVFSLDFPLITEAAVDEYVRKIKAVEILYKRRFSEKNPFYVVLYPERFERKHRYLIRKYLDKYGIRFVDYASYQIEQLIERDARLVEGHPSKTAHKFLAELLMEDLQLQ